MSSKKILVVEDDPDNLARLRETLTSRGHLVITASDRGTVVDRAARELPDLILMGDGTAEQENHEAARKLKAEPLTSSIPVIDLSTMGGIGRKPDRHNPDFDSHEDPVRGRSRFIDMVEDALQLEWVGGGEFSIGRPAIPASVDPAADAGVILVVEDEQKNWKEISSVLGPIGYSVRGASGSEEAIEAIAANRTDLVLIDFNFNGGSGTSLIRRLRADRSTRSLPIVLLTSPSNRSQKQDGMDAGCDDFIEKPIDRTELTARARSLIRLSRSRAYENDRDRLDTLLGEMGEGIVFLDPHWNVTEINDAARRLLELAHHGWRGVNLLDHIFGSRQVTAKRSSLANPEKQTVRFEIRREQSDTSAPLSLSVFARKFLSEDGKVREIILMVKDITGKRDEERMKDEFLSTVSHKLKTPLSVIMANVEYLISGYYGNLSDEQSDAAREIGVGARQLLDLFDKLLAFISPGSLDGSEPMPRTLTSLLEVYVARIQKREENRAVQFELDVDESLRDATIDFPSFDIALESIVENAVKFNPGNEARVIIRAAPAEDSSISISVTDNGPGIPPEHREKIFQRFYQIEKFHTGNVAGVGLGLPLARRLIERHGGTVEIDSQVGQGSTFRITVAAGAALDSFS